MVAKSGIFDDGVLPLMIVVLEPRHAYAKAIRRTEMSIQCHHAVVGSFVAIANSHSINCTVEDH
jgi:hypothetical protein